MCKLYFEFLTKSLKVVNELYIMVKLIDNNKKLIYTHYIFVTVSLETNFLSAYSFIFYNYNININTFLFVKESCFNKTENKTNNDIKNYYKSINLNEIIQHLYTLSKFVLNVLYFIFVIHYQIYYYLEMKMLIWYYNIKKKILIAVLVLLYKSCKIKFDFDHTIPQFDSILF